MPDNEVQSWHEYQEYMAYAERFAEAQGDTKSTERQGEEAPGKSGPPGASLGGNGVISHAVSHVTEKLHGHENQHPLGTVAEWADDADRRNASRHDASATREADVNNQLDGINEKAAMGRASDEAPSPVQPAGDETFPSLDSTMLSPPTTEHEKNTQQHRKTTFSSTTSGDKEKASTAGSSTLVGGTLANHGSTKKRRRGTTKGSRKGFSGSDDLLKRADAEELLSMVQGHLVMFPYDWLVKEELNSNWLYQVDQVAPLQIYN